MPIDTKRLPVPEESFTPYSFAKHSRVEDGRPDGRTPDQLRPIFLKTGVVSQAKGSAYIEMKDTKLMCSVYGPREVTRREDFSLRGQLNCELKFATFSCRIRRKHQADAEEKDLSTILTQALEPAVQLDKFPKARMDVFVVVLQDAGGALAGALTAASVALAEAGVHMHDLVIGCHAHAAAHDVILLDPSLEEDYVPSDSRTAANRGAITLGLMPCLQQTSCLLQHGHMSVETVARGVEACVDGARRLYPVVQAVLAGAVQARTAPAEVER